MKRACLIAIAAALQLAAQSTFQRGTDAGSNLSQLADGSVSSSKAMTAGLCTVALSATPTFDASQCNTFVLTLGATTVTASSLVNAHAGQELTFILIQDLVGGRVFVFPTNVLRPCTIASAAGASTIVKAVFDGTNANAYTCTSGDTPTAISGPTRAAPGTPISGLTCWFDSTANTWLCKDASGNVYAALLTKASATSNQVMTYVDQAGVQHTAGVSEGFFVFTDVNTANATASQHGLLPKLDNNASHCFLGNGTFGSCPAAAPPGSPGQFLYNNSGAVGAKAIAAGDLPAVNLPTPGTSITLSAPAGYGICTGACTVTLPVPAAGYTFCIYDDDAVTSAITINNPGTGVMFGLTDRSGYGTATTGTAVSTAGTNSQICFYGRDATHYSVGSFTGTWTMN